MSYVVINSISSLYSKLRIQALWGMTKNLLTIAYNIITLYEKTVENHGMLLNHTHQPTIYRSERKCCWGSNEGLAVSRNERMCLFPTFAAGSLMGPGFVSLFPGFSLPLFK